MLFFFLRAFDLKLTYTFELKAYISTVPDQRMAWMISRSRSESARQFVGTERNEISGASDYIAI